MDDLKKIYPLAFCDIRMLSRITEEEKNAPTEDKQEVQQVWDMHQDLPDAGIWEARRWDRRRKAWRLRRMPRMRDPVSWGSDHYRRLTFYINTFLCFLWAHSIVWMLGQIVRSASDRLTGVRILLGSSPFWLHCGSMKSFDLIFGANLFLFDQTFLRKSSASLHFIF